MATCPFRKPRQSGPSGWHFVVLAIAALQAGCALPGTEDGFLSSFAALNKVVPESPAQVCMKEARKLERKGQVEPAIAKYEEARRLDATAPVARPLALL